MRSAALRLDVKKRLPETSLPRNKHNVPKSREKIHPFMAVLFRVQWLFVLHCLRNFSSVSALSKTKCKQSTCARHQTLFSAVAALYSTPLRLGSHLQLILWSFCLSRAGNSNSPRAKYRLYRLHGFSWNHRSDRESNPFEFSWATLETTRERKRGEDQAFIVSFASLQ